MQLCFPPCSEHVICPMPGLVRRSLVGGLLAVMVCAATPQAALAFGSGFPGYGESVDMLYNMSVCVQCQHIINHHVCAESGHTRRS